MRRRGVLGIAAAGAAAALGAGCGFQLRASSQLPFRRLYTTFAPGSGIGLEFRRQVRASGTELVDRAADADAVFVPLLELREREIVGFSITGRPREYQLRLRFRWQLLRPDGTEWVAPNEVVLRRDVTTTDRELNAKQQEDIALYRALEEDLVVQLLRRLAAVRG